ncbi:hypothetical protein BDU57DRAFT_573413 [Ampelomyces quisqualis]|uniref:BTB domain-containing protein n=1 Tax=Ampelomyces quisqualis TaxID=50730 RepID=A0A6A5QM15_AMPQU|nr:hypothetical protein BDU57DRAFT_573413 [Ampelomyces quisqualis]
MAQQAREELEKTRKSLLESGKYSDFVITCKGDKYRVHKSVVCASSGFFERAERFPTSEKGEKDTVDLPEDEQAVIKLLICYLYESEYAPKLPDVNCMDEISEIAYSGPRSRVFHDKFPHTCAAHRCPDQAVCPHHYCQNTAGTNGCNSSCVDFICKICCPNAPPLALPSAPGQPDQLLLHSKMYEIADKYDVIGLKQLAREKFLRAASKFWDHEQFPPAAHYAFSTTPEEDKGLRDIVSNIILKHMSLLNKPAIEALLTEFNGLAVASSTMAPPDAHALLSTVESLLKSGAYSDLIITCGPDVHKVHKAIVCPGCDFFKVQGCRTTRNTERLFCFMCKGFAGDTIDLPEDEPETTALLLF